MKVSAGLGARASGRAEARAEAKVEAKLEPRVEAKVEKTALAKGAVGGAGGGVGARVPADAKTVAGSRRAAGAGDAAAKARLESQMATGSVSAGLQGKLEAQPKDPPYTKEQRAAQDLLLKEGEMVRDSDDKPLPPQLRTTADGKVLPAESASVLLNGGNWGEMNLIRTPEGEYYKQMVDGPAVKMSKAEVAKLRENLKQNPDPGFSPDERVGVDYKHIYNDLVGPERAIDSEPAH